MNKYTHTAVITIGRNVGDAPMDDRTWHDFKSDILASIRIAGGCTIVQAPSMAMGPSGQVGMWEGKVEGAAAFVLLVKDERDTIGRLRALLESDRIFYKQDAIGFIVVPGTDHLITAV
jgi:hypothetical protein